MPLLRNVTIRDASHDLATHLDGNLEHKSMDLNATAAIAGHFKKGAFYTATDGHTTWKVMFRGHDAQYVHFEVM